MTHPHNELPTSSFQQWGMEGMGRLETAFWMPERELYTDEITPGPPVVASHPAFMWGCGIMLSALNAAAQLDRETYLTKMERYVAAMDSYWVEANGIGGYDVLPQPKPLDRYYDDNAWIVLDLADAYELTHDSKILERAEKTFKFVMSGWDDVLGGGIYWHEGDLQSKNTCSNAPALVSALRLFQITQDRAYLTTAEAIYAWTNAHLQDTDGLFFDAIGINGHLDKKKYCYNSALMLRANTLMFQRTHDSRYLDEAQRMALAAKAYWVHTDTGAIADDAAFAHLLTEAFLFLHDQDHDADHLRVVRRALEYLHENGLDAAGDYTHYWDRPRLPGSKVDIKAQAAAVRAYLVAAPYYPEG